MTKKILVCFASATRIGLKPVAPTHQHFSFLPMGSFLYFFGPFFISRMFRITRNYCDHFKTPRQINKIIAFYSSFLFLCLKIWICLKLNKKRKYSTTPFVMKISTLYTIISPFFWSVSPQQVELARMSQLWVSFTRTNFN